MVIEQQQILTTQNLAALFAIPSIKDQLQESLPQLARQCFRWICGRLQMKVDHWHGRMIMVKNAAYAWRQMMFFLALVKPDAVSDFIQWSYVELDRSSGDLPARLRPVIRGLEMAAAGDSLDGYPAEQAGVRRFLGWSVSRHWLLE